MYVQIYVPRPKDILDPPDSEEEDREILEYLRHGGILLGDRIGEIEGFVPAVKPYRKLPEPDPQKVIEETYGPFLPLPESNFTRCIRCNRSMPFDPSRESICSEKCREILEHYREATLIRLGMK